MSNEVHDYQVIESEIDLLYSIIVALKIIEAGLQQVQNDKDSEYNRIFGQPQPQFAAGAAALPAAGKINLQV
jgi:hypothetical protein